jgi:hypothetical protein
MDRSFMYFCRSTYRFRTIPDQARRGRRRHIAWFLQLRQAIRPI